jgi:DNA primase
MPAEPRCLASGLLHGPATIWAALSTSGMESLRLPALAGHLSIATDDDEPGRKAGETLAVRATETGWRVSLLPAPPGRDWNDVLAQNGDAA